VLGNKVDLGMLKIILDRLPILAALEPSLAFLFGYTGFSFMTATVCSTGPISILTDEAAGRKEPTTWEF
jgi:hypothetical protein